MEGKRIPGLGLFHRTPLRKKDLRERKKTPIFYFIPEFSDMALKDGW